MAETDEILRRRLLRRSASADAGTTNRIPSFVAPRDVTHQGDSDEATTFNSCRRVIPAVVALCAGPAAAQTDFEGLVNVNIQDVLQDIAVELNVDENNIPVTLQVPVSVAANVCDVDVGVLSAQVDTGDATCVAVTGSQEMTQIVQQEMAAGGTAPDDEDTAAGDDTGTGGTTDDTAATDDGTVDDDIADTGDATDGTTAGTEGDTDETTTGSTSGREFTPGQQDAPANTAAPGQRSCARSDEAMSS